MKIKKKISWAGDITLPPSLSSTRLFRDNLKDWEVSLTIFVFSLLILLPAPLSVLVLNQDDIPVLFLAHFELLQLAEHKNLRTCITLCNLIIDRMCLLECSLEACTLSLNRELGECCKVDPPCRSVDEDPDFDPRLSVRSDDFLHLRILRNLNDVSILEGCASIDLVDALEFGNVVHDLHSRRVIQRSFHDLLIFITELQRTNVSKC